MSHSGRGGRMSWHWKHRLTYVCSASLHCNESVYVYACVCRCEIMWETVKHKQARTPSEAEYRASPSAPPPPPPSFSHPLWFFFLFSSSVAPLPYCGKRSSHFHSSCIHSFPPLSFVCTPKQGIFRVRWEQRWEKKKSKTQLGWSTSQVDVCVIGVMWKPEPTSLRLYANVP